MDEKTVNKVGRFAMKKIVGRVVGTTAGIIVSDFVLDNMGIVEGKGIFTTIGLITSLTIMTVSTMIVADKLTEELMESFGFPTDVEMMEFSYNPK